MSQPILEARDIRVSRGVFLLAVPHLAIMKGETLGIVGPNGAGKSTLLSALMGLMPGMGGTLIRDGRPLPPRPSREWRRRISAVFQQPLLLDDSVLGNLLTALAFKGISGSRAKDEARRWLAYFGIPDLETRHSHSLSGGEAQRVSLARAFLGDPDIIFLDEPFSALDPPTRASLVGDLADILRRTGTTAVMVTHMLDEMAVLCHRAAVMISGRLHQDGSPEDILFRPATPAIARFVGMDNVFPAMLSGATNGSVARLSGSNMEVILPVAYPDGPALIGFRPESALVRFPGEPAAAGPTLSGPITRISPGTTGYRLSIAGPLPAVVECDRLAFLRHRPATGQEVQVTVLPEEWHVIRGS